MKWKLHILLTASNKRSTNLADSFVNRIVATLSRIIGCSQRWRQRQRLFRSSSSSSIHVCCKVVAERQLQLPLSINYSSTVQISITPSVFSSRRRGETVDSLLRLTGPIMSLLNRYHDIKNFMPKFYLTVQNLSLVYVPVQFNNFPALFLFHSNDRWNYIDVFVRLHFYEFYCVLLYIMYCIFSFTLSVCMCVCLLFMFMGHVALIK